MPILNKTLSRLTFLALVISFIATLVVVQTPLLNILLIAALIVLMGLSVKQLSGSNASSFLIVALSLGVAMLNIDRMGDQSVALYKICKSQMITGGAVAADVAEGSNCSDRYIGPGLWRLKA
jgi:hypothetical protein